MRKLRSSGLDGVLVPMLRHLVHVRREFTLGKSDSLATSSGAQQVRGGHADGNPATEVREVERGRTVARSERRTYDTEQGRIGRTVNSGAVTVPAKGIMIPAGSLMNAP